MTNEPRCPTRVAIVGSGPSGFFTAGHLLGQNEIPVVLDMFDRLPTPFGLVRAGVAPDHSKIKMVTKVFDSIARRPGFRFFGNIEVGRDVTADELSGWYDAVVYATGASTDKHIGIVGDHLRGNYSAVDFVGWYNGHPDHANVEIDLHSRRAAVIGNGNVALDVARMLVTSTTDLAATDVAEHALNAFAHSTIEEVVVIGRRGPAEASFTAPELLELSGRADVAIEIDAGPDGVRAPRETDDSNTKRVLEALRMLEAQNAPADSKRIVLKFLAAPTEIIGTDRVEAVRFAVNELVADEKSVVARPTGRTETVEAGLVIRAVGYASVPIPGVPFDYQAARICNDDGRITVDGKAMPGLYAVGWAKRGPSGIIGTNKLCARETADKLLDDVRARGLETTRPLPAHNVVDILRHRGSTIVDYDGWERIDHYECATGQTSGRPRVKVTAVATMVEVAC